ncbi:DAK2 domain-containing protein [Pseudonocardia sp. RS11V-5]|uniref:DAK2 domain-containing protein n=1 Tax=Pseudonocardia terrae TaxID=2905831 RepID=UPI001E35A149|nr:DAK2 domain-containing protein [Pseudonocardia terrae]MCE3553053.1 DAK2 domain-containing protein [Pseudonocardia terrae]
MPPTLDAALLRRWAAAAVAGLDRHRGELDAINVFPVADADTGTNMLLTLQAGADAVDPVSTEAAEVAATLAKGALRGARGNSGTILSQLLRGLAEAVGAGEDLPGALRRAAELATAAVAEPREGTMLTVIAAAAEAAAELGGDPAAVADAAHAAVARTTGQLAELSRAGVVDAGGLGVAVVLDALVEACAGRVPERSRVVVRDRAALTAARESGSEQYDSEVMYLLDRTSDDAVTGLRARLTSLGDSVVVVGDGSGTWNVHVHCTDVGAAIEAGVEAGRPHRITVMRFDDRPPEPERPAFRRPRAVLMIATGRGVAELARAAGADVLETRPGHTVSGKELTDAVEATGAAHVALMTCDIGLLSLASRVAGAARDEGREVVVVPTTSVPQGLAALAVHDLSRNPADDVVAMAEAAAGTRTGGLLVAEAEALTWVGRCAPGEVLGMSEGEVVLIAPDLTVGALWLAHRMLTPGGELVTALLGADAPEELGSGLAEDLRRTHPEVDVVVYRGGQADFPLVLGVE